MAGAHEAKRKDSRRSRYPGQEDPARTVDVVDELYRMKHPEEQTEPETEEEVPAADGQEPDTGAERKARSGWFVGLMSAFWVLVVLAASAAGFVYYTATLDTIYPNVLLDGVSVGGATPEAAVLMLQSRGMEGYGGKTVTVELPMKESLTVQAEQVGLGGTPQAAAAEAFAYGREGGYIRNALNYLRCWQGQGVNILWRGSGIDSEKLTAIVNGAAEPLNRRLDSAGAEIGEQSVSFTKGAGALEVNVQELSDVIGLAFAAEDYGTIVYEPQINGEANVELENLFHEIYAEPQNASYDKETGEVIASMQGLTFDMAEAQEILAATLNGQELSIPLQRTEPEISTDMMEEYIFRDKLSGKGTSLSGSSSSRINNVRLSAQAIDGLVLLPGEEFNYNDALGERTSAKGYQAAGVYSDGQHTTGIGGGICQTSSTLYYCALYADLEITERWDHYFPVSYLPMGLDATVSWYTPNFRFVNNRDYPIKISAWVEDGYLNVQIWGTNLDGSYVKVTTDGWEDADFYYAMAYRRLYDADGNLIREDDGVYSRYHKHEKTDE